ncbi:hypothetical protein HYU19_01335 [Candidatus Woesearchaeota archaeon]|nr:hypothetical protein [Candidatus Woesearchaeota archaeon]
MRAPSASHATTSLPSIEQALALFDEYKVPKNIKAHCQKVSEVATFIARKMERRGMVIDVELVRIGAALHDWMKAATLERLEETKQFGCTPTPEEKAIWKKIRARFAGKHEGEIAAELLQDKYPQLAAFLRKKDAIMIAPDAPQSWELRMVHYADWRVLGDTIVSLQERMDDMSQRYAVKIATRGPAWWTMTQQKELESEAMICTAAGITPKDIR